MPGVEEAGSCNTVVLVNGITTGQSPHVFSATEQHEAPTSTTSSRAAKSRSLCKFAVFFCLTDNVYSLLMSHYCTFFSLYRLLRQRSPDLNITAHVHPFFQVLNIGGTNVYHGVFFCRRPLVVDLASCSQQYLVACRVESGPTLALVAHGQRFLRSSLYRTVSRDRLPSYRLYPQPPCCPHAIAVR